MSQHVKSISIDEELLKEVDEELKNSVFNGLSQLVSFLLHRYLHQRKLSKYKDIILYLTILLCFALTLIVIIMVR